MAEQAEDVKMIASCSNYLGDLLLAQKQFDQAEQHYERARLICRDLTHQHDPDRLATALLGLAQIAQRRGENSKAVDLFEECLAIQRDHFLRLDKIAEIEHLYALLKEEMGDLARAQELAQAAGTVYQKLGMSKEEDETQAMMERLKGKLSADR